MFLKKIDKINSKRIIKKIEEISNNVKRYIEPLKDIEEDKIRVGKFRLFVKYDEKEDVLKIYTIKHRKNAYKR
ncbi:MAG: type II toxin-antitoxin system RelE family toxin [Nanoarchaeota archaeon]